MSEHLHPDQLLLYVSGQMDARARSDADAHLKTCPPCRGMLAVQQRSFAGNDAQTMDARGRQGVDGTTTLPVMGPRTQAGPNPFADLEPTVRHQGTTSKGRPAFQVSHTDTATTNQDLPPAGSSPESVIGHKVGDYILERVIGQGGMAAVYQAIHPLIGKQVAIKVMLPVRDDSDFAQRMVQEAQTVNAIEHPNIVEIYGAGTLNDGRPYIVMQYLDGVSLSHWVRERDEDVPLETTLRILEQLFSALDAAHQAGVVHRDIKPANVMLTNLSAEVPTVKVVDFGLAKGVNASVRTAPDLVLGTPGYVSPEQIRGSLATARSDLYSAGLVAWYLVARTEPYPREDHVLTTMRKQMNEPPAPLAPRSGLPAALCDLIEELCRIDPARRPVSGAAVAARLRAMSKKPLTPSGRRWEQIANTPEERTVPERPQVPPLRLGADPIAPIPVEGRTRPDRPAAQPARLESQALERLRADEPPPGARRSGSVPKLKSPSNTRLETPMVTEPAQGKGRSRWPYVALVVAALAIIAAAVAANFWG